MIRLCKLQICLDPDPLKDTRGEWFILVTGST